MADRRREKLFNIDVKAIDEDSRTVKFCFSDDQPDREGEVLDQATWDVANYQKNPVILFGHDPSQPENVLGQGISLDLNIGGKSYVTAQFDDAATNPRADMVFRQLARRTLRTVSAGFINHSLEWDNDTPVLKDNELLEISVVPIPANPRALSLALREGSMTRKDASYLLESMRNEAALIEKQLETTEEENEHMEEVKEQLGQLAGLVTKIAESQAVLTETVEKLVTHEQEETTDTTAGETTTDDTTDTAQTEEVQSTDTDAAKGGSDDQSGASEEFDENAELTDEQKAQIDDAFDNLTPESQTTTE